MSLRDLNVKIGADIAKLDTALTKASKRMESFANRMHKQGTQISVGIGASLGALGVAALNSTVKMERLEAGLTTMMGSSTMAAAELEKLRKVAEMPGLEFMQAVQGSTKLQAVGLSADEARAAMESFGNAMALAGGSSADLDGVTLALTQIVSKGKVSAEEINQLAERVPQIRAIMLKAFGSADTEVLQKMGISSEEFVAKATAELAKLPKATTTLGDHFENLKTGATLALATLGESIAKAFNFDKWVPKVTEKLASIARWFDSLNDRTKKIIVVVGALVIALGPMLMLLGSVGSVAATMVKGFTAITSIVKGVGAAFTFLASPTGLIIAAITLLAGLGLYVYKNWDAFKARFAMLWQKILGMVEWYINSYIKLLNVVLDPMGMGIKPIKLTANDVIDMPSFQSFGEFVSSLKSDLSNLTGIGFSSEKPAKSSGGGGDTTGVPSGDKEYDRNAKGGAAAKGATGAEEDAAAKTDYLDELQQKLALVDARYKVFGDTVSVTDEKVGAIRATMEDMLANSIDPADPKILALDARMRSLQGVTDALPTGFDLMKQKIAEMSTGAIGAVPVIDNMTKAAERLAAANKAIMDVTEAAGNAMEQYALQGGKSFKEMGKAALKGAADIVRAKLMAAVASAFEAGTVAASALGPAAPLVGAAAAAAAGMLFNSALSALNIPALANGGLAFGPTMALVGEYGGASGNPEVIAPLNKLQSMLQVGDSGGGGWISNARLQGSDIVLAYERSNRIDRRAYSNELYAY
jgi:tape measure domain-containing protein